MKRRHETRDDDDDAAGEPEKGRKGGENERPQKRPVEEAGRTKTSLYNEEAAGRLGTGSSHYRRSSSATRLSVLVVRHANVERPARCTCSRTAHRSSVTAPPHTRARSPSSSSPRQRFVSFLLGELVGGQYLPFFCSLPASFALSSPVLFLEPRSSLFSCARRTRSEFSSLLLPLLEQANSVSLSPSPRSPAIVSRT